MAGDAQRRRWKPRGAVVLHCVSGALHARPLSWLRSRPSRPCPKQCPSVQFSLTQIALSFPPIRSRESLTSESWSVVGRVSPARGQSPFPPPFSVAELGAPTVCRPRAQTEPAWTSADELVSPSIVLFRSGQVSLRPRRCFRTRVARRAPGWVRVRGAPPVVSGGGFPSPASGPGGTPCPAGGAAAERARGGETQAFLVEFSPPAASSALMPGILVYIS